jgi:hypothetical protein
MQHYGEVLVFCGYRRITDWETKPHKKRNASATLCLNKPSMKRRAKRDDSPYGRYGGKVRFLKSTMAGILLLLFTTVVLFTTLLLVARVEGHATVAIVPGWYSPRFWLSMLLAVAVIFGAGFLWELREFPKTTPRERR